jgi:hypothetical protein
MMLVKTSEATNMESVSADNIDVDDGKLVHDVLRDLERHAT